MSSYCLKYKKNTESINPRLSKTSNNKTMLRWKYAIYSSKKSIFIKKQEASKILSSLGLKAPLSKIPLFGGILFRMLSNRYKMNKIINNFLVEEKLMPEMHIKQPDLLDKSGFSYSTWGPFTKNKERIQKLKKKKNTGFKIYLQKWIR